MATPMSERISDFITGVLELCAEVGRRLLNLLNWRLVRSLGELQILTRASYILLVIVPLLAALWPAVRMLVNTEGRAIESAAQVLRGAASEIDRATTRATQTIQSSPPVSSAGSAASAAGVRDAISRVERAAQRLEEAAEQRAKELESRVLTEPRLPWTLAAAFFAALFVVLGHLLYQLYAPEPVRSMSWDAFVAARKDEYAKHPTDDALERAQQLTETRLGRRLDESGRFEAEDVLERLFHMEEDRRRSYIADMPKERVRRLMAWIEEGNSPAPIEYKQEVLSLARERLGASGADNQYLQVRRMTTIERGARAEYLRLAAQYPVFTFLTFVLYGMAVWLIALVIKVQTTSVAEAASVRSLADLFLHGV